MANDTVNDEETVSFLVLITPLYHSVVRHDFLKTLVSNTTFEADKRLSFICCAVLKEFSAINPSANLLSLAVLCCDERTINDVGNVNGWCLSSVACSILHS